VTEFGPSADQAAALRLPSTVSKTTRKQIVEQTLQGQCLLAHLDREIKKELKMITGVSVACRTGLAGDRGYSSWRGVAKGYLGWSKSVAQVFQSLTTMLTFLGLRCAIRETVVYRVYPGNIAFCLDPGCESAR
jgi:hypothetical protein